MSISLSVSSPSMREESVYTEITDHSRQQSDSIVNAVASAKTSLRVRIINQVSNLFKDVLVEIRNDLNLYDALYDKKAVKKANIRKWGSDVTKQVKSGSHEIRCSIWDDEVNSPCHTYSIEDMKNTSTRQLYHLVGPESDLIKLKLQCVEKKTIDTQPSSTATQNFHSPTQGSSTSGSADNLCKPSVDDLEAPDNLSSEKSAGKRNAVKTKRIDARFNHATISPSDSGSLRCRDSSHRSRHSIHSNPVNDAMSELDDYDNSTIRTVPTTKSLGQSVLEAKSTMTVKLSNESSKRQKDLVVDIKADLFVYDSIYDNKSVKNAQVRKWTSDVVKDVKKKIKEVQCVVMDLSAEESICATFSVDDLRRLSTRDLFDLVGRKDPVQLVLRCVETRVNSNITSTPLTSKRSTRPNHMNLSALKLNGSFSSFGDSRDSSGSKNFSHTDSNASFISEEKSLTKPSCLRSRNSSKKYFSELLSTTENQISLEHVKTEYEDLKSASTKQFVSTLLEDDIQQPCSDNVARDSIQNEQQTAPMNASTFDKEKLSAFKRLCRSKKGSEFQSGDNLDKMMIPRSNDWQKSIPDPRNASFKSLASDARDASFKIPSSDIRKAPVSEVRSSSFKSSVSDKRETTIKQSMHDMRNGSLKTIDSETSRSQSNDSKSKNSSGEKKTSLTGSDKISRFLQFSATRRIPVEGLKENAVPLTTLSRGNSQKSVGSVMANTPPIAEIEVVKDHSSEVPTTVDKPSIPLSGDLVKEIFPYHIVINEDFCIVQIGNSLARLIENQFLIDKCISDLFTITGPIPSFGKEWDWKVMDKMKEKTIFLEGLYSNSFNQKPKIKGSMIELSKAPNRQVLLALSPNVKNLSELEAMNLSMTDLPLHSCQRDAVLLGEHSKSEVKLTNHLDQLHRDLIDSMEKQIEDRTNELATANTNLEAANAQLAVQSAKQLEHFACMSHEIRTPLNCIVGMSSLLLEDSEGPSMDPTQSDSIRMINTSGELLRAVVDDVLDYAKLESGSFEVDIKPTKLQDTLDSVLYSISQKVQDKNIRLRTHFTPTIPEYIETDSRRLQQVLFNLLGNAGKFSKTDSVIDLSVSLIKASSENDPKTQINNGDVIRFSIRDYGKGIEKKDFETIFQPFSQAR